MAVLQSLSLGNKASPSSSLSLWSRSISVSLPPPPPPPPLSLALFLFIYYGHSNKSKKHSTWTPGTKSLYRKPTWKICVLLYPRWKQHVNKTQYRDTSKEIIVPNAYLENAQWLHGSATWIKRHRGGTGEIPVPIAYLEDVFWLPAMMVSTNALGSWSGYRQGRSHCRKETNIHRIMNCVLYQACQLAAGCVTCSSCGFCQASINRHHYRINMAVWHGYLSSSPWWTEFRTKPVD